MHELNYNQLLGPLSSLFSSITWAIGVTVYSKLSNKFSASTVNFSRALVALPLFIISSILICGSFNGFMIEVYKISISNFLWLSMSSLCSYALGDVFFLWSTALIGVPAALVVASSYPIWSALMGYVFLNQDLRLLQIIGLLCIFLGTSFVVLSKTNFTIDSALKDPKQSKVIGFIFALATSIFWSLNAWSVSRGSYGLIASIGNSVRMLMALVLCPVFGVILYNFKLSKMPFKLMPGSIFIKFIWIFILEGFGGAYFFLYGLANSTLAIAAALSSLAPVVSVPILWFTKSEHICYSKFFGTLLAVTGVLLLILT